MPATNVETSFVVLPEPARADVYFDLIDVPLDRFPRGPNDDHKLNVPSVRITPEMAETFLEAPKRMQRTTRVPYIKRLGHAMEAKKFVSDTPIVIGMLTTDLRAEFLYMAPAYLLDGQHRLSGVVKSGNPQTFDFVFRAFGTEEEMRTYALTLDSGMKRNNHHQSGVAEYHIRLGVGKHDAGAYSAAIRAIMREGLDPTLEYGKADEPDPIMVDKVGQHYLAAGKLLFNLFRYGETNPSTTATELQLDFRRQLRQNPILAPLLVWINKDTALVRNFLTPILMNNQLAVSPIQNTFLEVIRQGFDPKPGEYRAVMGELPGPGYLKSGNKTQRRGLMATSICLSRFRVQSTRNRQYDRRNLVKDVLRTVDLVISRGGEIDWPNPVATGSARNAA
jgi:hypothetical protein